MNRHCWKVRASGQTNQDLLKAGFAKARQARLSRIGCQLLPLSEGRGRDTRQRSILIPSRSSSNCINGRGYGMSQSHTRNSSYWDLGFLNAFQFEIDFFKSNPRAPSSFAKKLHKPVEIRERLNCPLQKESYEPEFRSHNCTVPFSFKL